MRKQQSDQRGDISENRGGSSSESTGKLDDFRKKVMIYHSIAKTLESIAKVWPQTLNVNAHRL
jgi:hypothetical protein